MSFESEEELIALRHDQKIGDILREKLTSSTDHELFLEFFNEIQSDGTKAIDAICYSADAKHREQARQELIGLRWVEKKIYKFITRGDQAHDEIVANNRNQDQETEDG